MTVALVLAAGSGERLGAELPKAYVELAGRPMLAWSLRALVRVPGIERIVLVTPPSVDVGGDFEHHLPTERASDPPIDLVAGGEARSESVQLGLAAVPTDEGDLVLVHDAARPLLRPSLAQAAIGALGRNADAQAAIAAVPVTDTIKRVDDRGAVVETLDRHELRAVQTPQVFRRRALEAALDVPATELARATDDAWLVERMGGRVLVVPADAENLKITTALDLRLAAELLAARERSGG